MTRTDALVGSGRRWLLLAFVLAAIVVAIFRSVDGGDVVAPPVAVASAPTPAAASNSSTVDAVPQSSLADSSKPVPTGVSSSIPARADMLPAFVVRDPASGVPYPKRTTAEALPPPTAPPPAGGPSNGVVTDAATGVTRVNGSGATSGR